MNFIISEKLKTRALKMRLCKLYSMEAKRHSSYPTSSGGCLLPADIVAENRRIMEEKMRVSFSVVLHCTNASLLLMNFNFFIFISQKK